MISTPENVLEDFSAFAVASRRAPMTQSMREGSSKKWVIERYNLWGDIETQLTELYPDENTHLEILGYSEENPLTLERACENLGSNIDDWAELSALVNPGELVSFGPTWMLTRSLEKISVTDQKDLLRLMVSKNVLLEEARRRLNSRLGVGGRY